MKILVVDDERWIRKGIVKMIQKESLGIDEILEADGVMSGWETFLEDKPELVISDVKFPVDNGCMLCEKIYADFPKTKFIMLSGYDEFGYVKAALQYRVIDYLLKPVDKNVLNNTIKQAMEEYKKEEEDEKRLESKDNKLNSGQKKKQVPPKNEEIIQQVMAEIELNYNQKISLSELAKKYFINETYFSNLFTKTAGISLINFHMNVRVEKAKTLLMTTKMSITEIALRVGYENARYFTRVFKKMTGETPKEFRSRMEREFYEEA